MRCLIAVITIVLTAGCHFVIPGLEPGAGDVDLSRSSEDGAAPDLAQRDGGPDLPAPQADIAGFDIAGFDIAGFDIAVSIDMTKPPPDLAGPCTASCGTTTCQPCCNDICNMKDCAQSCGAACGDCRLACTSANTCSFNCSAASTCAATAEAGTKTASLVCGAAARCRLACDNANACTVACGAAAQCLVECGGSKSCDITGCSPMTCPNGVLVCNRACP